MVAAAHAAGISCIVKGLGEDCSFKGFASVGGSIGVFVGSVVVKGGSCEWSIVGGSSEGRVVKEGVVVTFGVIVNGSSGIVGGFRHGFWLNCR